MELLTSSIMKYVISHAIIAKLSPSSSYISLFFGRFSPYLEVDRFQTGVICYIFNKGIVDSQIHPWFIWCIIGELDQAMRSFDGVLCNFCV